MNLLANLMHLLPDRITLIHALQHKLLFISVAAFYEKEMLSFLLRSFTILSTSFPHTVPTLCQTSSGPSYIHLSIILKTPPSLCCSLPNIPTFLPFHFNPFYASTYATWLFYCLYTPPPHPISTILYLL
jgi:hypothetical protein